LQGMANRMAEIKSVKHKIKTLADARYKQCDHWAGQALAVGRLTKCALFKSVLNCCCTAPVTWQSPPGHARAMADFP
jgi:hypothetical protein